MVENSCLKVPKSDFHSQFSSSKIIPIFLKKISLKNINLEAHFLFLLILCSIKIEWLLFLKFLKFLAFFDSYFRPFNKSEEKIKVIFVISVIMPSIWNVFIKFRWHDEKLTPDTYKVVTKVKTVYLHGKMLAKKANGAPSASRLSVFFEPLA